MDWLKEILKDLESASELESKIKKGIGENFVSKLDFNTANDAKKKFEDDIAARDKQLEDLKNGNKDVEGLQKEITKLQGENKANKETYEKELEKIKKSNALKLALVNEVHDVDLVISLLKDNEDIIFKDGELKGLDTVKDKLKEEKSFLFKTKEELNLDGAKPGEQGSDDNDISFGESFAKSMNEQNNTDAGKSIWND